MLFQIKNTIKKISIIRKTYEELWMLKAFICTKMNAKKSRSMVTKDDLERIQKYKNIHKGERCFIVGQGPSLTIDDLEKIRNEISFTVNSGPVAYNQTRWRAKYYVAFDSVVFDRVQTLLESEYEFEGIFVSNIDSKTFTSGTPLRSEGNRDNLIFLPTDFSCTYCLDTILNRLFPRIFNCAGFSTDIAKSVYSGTTVVYTSMQIAAYMGFSEIYLLGVDCDYSKEIKHAIVTMDSPELQYDKAEWMRAERIQLKQFQKLAEKGVPQNIEIYNVSRAGKLNSFPRKELEEVLI